MKKLILYGLACIILLNAAMAIGLAPAYIDVVYSPGKSKSVDIVIINNENKDMDIALLPKGELAKYIDVPKEVIRVSSSEYTKTVSYTVDMPDELDPGLRIGEIMVVEVNDQDTSGNIVKTSLGIIHQLRVTVPYPEQYLQGTFYIDGIKPGEDNVITVGLTNLGHTELKDIQGTILVTDSKREGVAQLITNKVSLDSGQKGKITALWDTDVKPGRYYLQAVIQYEGKVLVIEKEVDVGDALLEIKELRTHPFKLGTIARLDIVLENRWNKLVQNVYSDVVIRDSTENEIFTYKTGLADVPADEEIESPIYWDTKNMDAGNYTIKVKTNYMGRFTEKLFRTVVSQNSIYVVGDSPTAEVVAGPGAVATGAVAVLVVIILGGIAAKFLLRKPKVARSVPQQSRTNLDKYIKEKIQQGYSNKAIRKNLMEKGWNQDVIDEEMLKLEDEK